MDFAYGPRTEGLRERLIAFRDAHILPNEPLYREQLEGAGDRWRPVPIVEELKDRARAEALWNLFLPGDGGAGLTNLEYAPLAEIMGCNLWAPEVFNCSAPDTGNMEVLAQFGTEEQKARWLEPLLAGESRPCFAMTEPEVASSDATNMQATGRLEGGEWVLNGRKWWISGAGDPRCRVAIFMCRTEPDGPTHRQHSQILVPMDASGISIRRMLDVFGYDHAPHGHAELVFEDVRVPAENVILGPGRGFEIAQARLGPGRIHHCMRSIGAAERSLALMIGRGRSRVAFGAPILDLGGNHDVIARSRIEIEMARLLVLHAAWLMDTAGNKAAASEIAQIKVVAPEVSTRVIDAAIQMHGGAGISQDTPLAELYAWERALRIVDGPDAVHLRTVARQELKKFPT